jgi:hypothetical protein
VQTTYQASYTNHYRRGLIRLLEVLEFRSDNSHQPPDPSEFIDQLREEMRGALRALNDAAPTLDFLEIRPRGRDGAIKLTPLDAAPEPTNLGRLKKVIAEQWGTTPLIDALNESVLRSNCPATIAAMTGRGDMDPAVMLERLLLCLYGYGTNTGIRTVAAGEAGHREIELYYVRRRYLTPDLARALAIDIANATFGSRQRSVWGEGSSAVASDSTHFGAWDSNIFTEWHSRYGGRGVLIYWHVERKSVIIHSQPGPGCRAEVIEPGPPLCRDRVQDGLAVGEVR